MVVWSRRWQAGDGLLLEVGQRFLQEHSGGSVDFTVVSPVEGAPWRSVLPSQRPRHALLAAVMLLFTVVATATQLLALGTAVLLSNIVFTVCGTVSVKDMFRAVSLRTLITVACALALGKALVRSAWRRDALAASNSCSCRAFRWTLGRQQPCRTISRRCFNRWETFVCCLGCSCLRLASRQW